MTVNIVSVMICLALHLQLPPTVTNTMIGMTCNSSFPQTTWLQTI
jgi:hypothetical protein